MLKPIFCLGVGNMTAEVGTGGIILVINTRVWCAGEAAISSAILAALLLDTVHLVNPLSCLAFFACRCGAVRCGVPCGFFYTCRNIWPLHNTGHTLHLAFFGSLGTR